MNISGSKFKENVASLFTCGNIVCGYVSILLVINSDFFKASLFLILAIIFDVMDGRIARMTNTTSDFGIQLDSLSDLVSFGIAPSTMIYFIALNNFGKIGIVITVLFVLCSALRLAKFNVIAKNNNLRNFFIGLPTPASTGLLVFFILNYKLPGFKHFALNISNNSTVNTRFLNIVLSFIMIALSFLMVSNIPYVSLKKIKISYYNLFNFFIITMFFICTFSLNIIELIFMLFFMYIMSGIFSYIYNHGKKILTKNK
ncbi:MAG: CDP-diacylglycerol--serine O-phosphatidyltransferase [Endomicrobium sp.]|nr:CDP-diacylglycerol--serine O-phosphatidyltransferase [Endomicrobium sp.]